MQKNAIITLVVGLIVGGLAMWLLMGLTGLGSTMVLNYSGTQKTANQNGILTTGTPTPSPTANNGLVTSEDYDSKCTDFTNLGPYTGEWTSDGEEFSMDFMIDGTKCGDTFTATKGSVSRVNTALGNAEKNDETPEEQVAILPLTAGDTDNFASVKRDIMDDTSATNVGVDDEFMESTKTSLLESGIVDAKDWSNRKLFWMIVIIIILL